MIEPHACTWPMEHIICTLTTASTSGCRVCCPLQTVTVLSKRNKVVLSFYVLSIERSLLSCVLLNPDKRTSYVRSTEQRCDKMWNPAPFACGEMQLRLIRTPVWNNTMRSLQVEAGLSMGMRFLSHPSSLGGSCTNETLYWISESGRRNPRFQNKTAKPYLLWLMDEGMAWL